MLIAVYARTLAADASLDEFIAAWLPPDATRDSYPVRCRIAVDPQDDRRVLSLFEIDAAPHELPQVLPTLVHPESEQRLTGVVDATELAGIYHVVDEFGVARARAS